MLCLAMDTCTNSGRFALAEDGRLLSYQPHNVSGSYADALLPVIDRLLDAAERPKDRIEAIAIAVGPGSFTGVRIGVATAKGLAWALGAGLFAVSSLETMAAALLAEARNSDLAMPVLDARRGEVYAGLFQRQDDWVVPLAAPAALTADQWWDRLVGVGAAPEQVVFGGEGTPILLGQGSQLRPELLSRGEPVLRSWTAAHPATAPVLARVVSGVGSPLKPVPLFTVVPLYLRGSDAELKMNLDLTPTRPNSRVDIHSQERGEN